jgi:tetratricopeptide (TPR) repeat protein
MAFEEYDHTRTFQPKRDYFGEVIEGERARPMQVCIWYPAVASPDADPVVLSDYAFTPPQSRDFYTFLSGIQNREVVLLHQIFRNDQNAVLEALGTDMKAVKDAPPAEGRHPLIIYHSHFTHGIAENAVLCEYLASHGFAVAVTHSFGPDAIRFQPSPAALETIVGDMEFVMGAVRSLEFIDPERVGAFGYGAGWIAALLLQMRNFNVDALVGLEPRVSDPEGLEVLKQNPYYSATRMTAPLLDVRLAGAEAENHVSMYDLKYGPRYSLEFADAGDFDLTTYGLMQAKFMPAGTPEFAATRKTYESLCRYVQAFFDAHINEAQESKAFLAEPPGEGLTITHLDATERPPTADEFMSILAEGNVETAVEIYEKFAAEDPDLTLFQEADMNMAGYRLLQTGRVAEAISLFEMNADAYPQSSNCWDSLAEAYMANGDNEKALHCVDKVLETLPNDTAISDDLRQALETNAQRYREMLEGDGADADAAGAEAAGEEGADSEGTDDE